MASELFQPKDHLDKPCYTRNYNEGFKNVRELFFGTTLIVPNAIIIIGFLAFCAYIVISGNKP